MNRFLFIPYALQLLSQGTFFRKLFFYFFRAIAVMTALAGLVVCAGLIKVVINLPAVGVVGGFVFIALSCVAFYAVAHIFWTRSDNIRALADGKFTMIPIYSIMVRTLGEVLAAFITVMSVGGFILFLFAPDQAAEMLGGIMPMNPLAMMLGRGGNPFIAAIIILVGGVIYAMLLLAFFYLIGEFISALAEIALNTGITAANTGLMLTTPRIAETPAFTAPPAQMPVTVRATAVRGDKRCAICGSVNPADSAFCENCGKPL